MNFAIINEKTNRVENIILAFPGVINGIEQAVTIEAGVGMFAVNCDDIVLNMGDNYDPSDGKFYRDRKEVSSIPPVWEQIQQAIDGYTFELITDGIIDGGTVK